jgi:hypothetical protein
MSEPTFLASVRAVDVVALAADLERQRRLPRTPLDAPAESVPTSLAVDTALYEQLIAEWNAGRAETQRGESAPDTTVGSNQGTGEAEIYWQNVDTVLNLFNRRSAATALLPHISRSFLPNVEILTAAGDDRMTLVEDAPATE